MQFHTGGPCHQPCVVSGAHGVEPEGLCTLEHGGELDVLVAAHARVGRAPGAVLSEEVV